MKQSEETKYELARSVKECMKTAPLERITVTQIAQNCGVTRQTFYRYFIDKYDLVNWYFEKLLVISFSKMNKGETIFESLVSKFNYISEEHVFLKQAFLNDDQNSLKHHDYEFILNFYSDLINHHYLHSITTEVRFLLEMYCRGSIEMTVDWVVNGRKIPPKKMAELLISAMPLKLQDIFIELGILR